MKHNIRNISYVMRCMRHEAIALPRFKVHITVEKNICQKQIWRLGWPLWNICVTNVHGYVPFVVNASWSFPHSWRITGFVRRVPLVDQELLTLPEHLSSPQAFSAVRVTRSLVLCVWFADRCLSFCPFSFGHCVVCSSPIYGFWLPLWYLQTLLTKEFMSITGFSRANDWIVYFLRPC
jgi:hypothetical protein